MHTPGSILLLPLLPLLTLTPSIAAIPVPSDDTDPSGCFGIQPITDTLEGQFNLEVISEGPPFQDWLLDVSLPSAETPQQPFISTLQTSRSVSELTAFTLTSGFLNLTRTDYAGRFAPFGNSPILKRWLFGGSREPLKAWVAAPNCDAGDSGYQEVRTNGQGRCCLFLQSFLASVEIFPSIRFFVPSYIIGWFGGRETGDLEREDSRSLTGRPLELLVQNFTEGAAVFGKNAGDPIPCKYLPQLIPSYLLYILEVENH